MQGNSIVLTGSLVNENESLIHKKNKIAKFFKYSEDEFKEIKDFTLLMPHSFYFLHPLLVRNFINKGTIYNLNKIKYGFIL